MATTIADYMVATLKATGVRRVYGIPGDSLNGFTDALRRDGEIAWQHVRHEEAAAFAAAAEAAVTGELAVTAASCGPGNLHLINGLWDAARSRVPVLAIAAHIPREEIGGGYFQETHPQDFYRELAVYTELVSIPEQLPRVLEIAMRTAISRSGVAVVVIPGEVFLADAPKDLKARPVRTANPVVRPDEEALAAAAGILNTAKAVTILAGAGVAGAHDEVVELAAALKAPIVHALRGKEFVEYDNPFDVGMTGLIGWSSGYRAMEHCDALLMLGTDFPYRPFYPPDGTPIIQVDLRGEQIGRRAPVEVPLTGTVRDTARALLPLLKPKSDSKHLDTMLGHYQRARRRLDSQSRSGRDRALSFVELEMKAAGIVNWGTDLDNPDFAGIATATGLFGVRVEQAGDLEDALRAAFEHDGPALVDVRTARQELSLPPKITLEQAKGFTLYATRTILSGDGAEILELARTNVRDLRGE